LQNRRLGRSELFLSALGLGCWQFSQGSGFIGRYWPALSETAIREIVAVSLAGGVNWFDTAEAYGRGQSERALARALESLGRSSGSVVVATKWWPVARTADSLTRTIGQRLGCLEPYPIDLYQIHQPYSLSSISKQMRAMAGIEQLRLTADRYGKTISQVALNWLVNRHGETVFAIPGASNIGQAKANTETLTFSLDPEEMERIDRVSQKVWQER